MDIVERLRQDWTCPICHDGIGEVVLEAAAEIARLRHEVGHLDDQIQTLLRENESLRAEVERLTAALNRIVETGSFTGAGLCREIARAALAAGGKEE